MPAARHLLRPPHAAPAALLPRRPVLFRLSAPPRAVVTQAMLEMANATTPTTIAAAIGMGVIVARTQTMTGPSLVVHQGVTVALPLIQAVMQ